MKMKHTKTLITALATTACVGIANAGSISSFAFDVDPASTSIDTTTGGFLDWGYFLPDADFLAGDQPDNTDFDSLVDRNGFTATNSKASPGIGTVTISERGEGEYSNGDTGKAWSFTVNDGIAPVSGTENPLGAVNGIASSEDIFNITFNDLTAGNTTVTLYMDHTNNGRSFDAAVDLFASDGDDLNNTLTSSSIGGSDGEGYFTFTVEVSNAVAGSDLSISIDSAGGGAGQFQFAGYTVEGDGTSGPIIPTPTSFVLAAAGMGVMVFRRRRN